MADYDLQLALALSISTDPSPDTNGNANEHMACRVATDPRRSTYMSSLPDTLRPKHVMSCG